jgi:glycosyltransferase involved in cell wall biosynthesis
MVTPYPPARDGIAAYAIQAVARLRADGHEVEVLSPGPSAAHHHLDLIGPRGPLALAKRVRAYDKVILQFHPDLFYPQPFADRSWTLTSYTLAAVFRLAKDIDIVVHETDYARGRMEGTLARAVRFMWAAAPSVVVHTEEERQSFHDAFATPLDRIRVAEHGAHFLRRTTVDRAGARAALGIPADVFMFLSIGFIQPHKGFDRAIRAFGRLQAGARLDIVGSVRVDEPAYLQHLEELKGLAVHTPGAAVHPGYVSDEAFDRWLVATDVVVLPYRHIWSSGVLERAALYDRPVIMTKVGGLPAQARPDTVIVDTDDELAQAMAVAAGVDVPAHPKWRLDGDGPVDRERVMAEVRARAARDRVAADAALTGAGARHASLPLHKVPPLAAPAPTSARPGAGVLKRVQRRLTAWELDPLISQVNRLRDATIEAADRLEAHGEPAAAPDE